MERVVSSTAEEKEAEDLRRSFKEKEEARRGPCGPTTTFKPVRSLHFQNGPRITVRHMFLIAEFMAN
jgi:hypothetical protein